MSYQHFPTASQNRDIARDRGVIHSEITAIQQAIILATQEGELSVVVNDSAFTQDSAYYRAWIDGFSDPARRDQIDTVTQYFTGRGYGVQIQETAPSAATISWIINW